MPTTWIMVPVPDFHEETHRGRRPVGRLVGPADPQHGTWWDVDRLSRTGWRRGSQNWLSQR